MKINNKTSFMLYDKVDKAMCRISSLNFDESGLVQVSFVNRNGKLVHAPIKDFELSIPTEQAEQDAQWMEGGHDYLMGVSDDKLTVEDALEAFGFGRNGLKRNGS